MTEHNASISTDFVVGGGIMHVDWPEYRDGWLGDIINTILSYCDGKE